MARHLSDEDLDALTLLVEGRILEELRRIREDIMAAIDDLNVSVTNLQTAVADLQGRVGTSNDPAIAAAAAAVQSATDTLNTLDQPTPPPAP